MNLTEIAKDLDGIDIDAYTAFGRDPLEPILCGGDLAARVGFFGRDPGRDEVKWNQPFVGAGGQRVRKVLYQVLHGTECPDFAASLDVGRYAFWANTVPYKPRGNKECSEEVRREFQPLIANFLIESWRGRDVITLGQNAFTWWGLQDKRVKAAIGAFWARADRFEASIEVTLRGHVFRLHPLPHPSPRNAVFYHCFAHMLHARLRALDLSLDDWRATGA